MPKSFLQRLTTKRFLFSAAGLAIATVMLTKGKIDCECWVYSLAIIIAGHHMEDCIRALKGVPK